METKAAQEAVERAWALTVKARALCPYAADSAVGQVGYDSPSWYTHRGAVYFVNLAAPLTREDVQELNEIGTFINRSFVIEMAAILEACEIVPYRDDPDPSKAGCDHVQLTRWLRNRFAHGQWAYNPADNRHGETRALLEKLFPTGAEKAPGFRISIDEILEPLKDGVLEYIHACS